MYPFFIFSLRKGVFLTMTLPLMTASGALPSLKERAVSFQKCSLHEVYFVRYRVESHTTA